MNNTTTTKFNLTSRVGAWWAQKREPQRQLALRQRCPPATIAASQIPASVRAAWARHAPDEFPGLTTDDGTWLRCSLGLAQFFEACRLQREHGACALPSKGADSVWHAWLKVDAAGLSAWQQRYFGRVVEHREAEHLGSPLDDCLARTWVSACRSEGRSPTDQSLPLLFALDSQLKLPTGWAYGYRRGRLVHRQIDGFGQPGGSFIEHPALAGTGLAAMGLLTAAEVERYRSRQSDSGGDGGSSTSSSSDCSDGGSSDGGSSCGSGCGGGGD